MTCIELRITPVPFRFQNSDRAPRRSGRGRRCKGRVLFPQPERIPLPAELRAGMEDAHAGVLA
jgi:hypothetical protein